jgi:hypothetical protein
VVFLERRGRAQSVSDAEEQAGEQTGVVRVEGRATNAARVCMHVVPSRSLPPDLLYDCMCVVPSRSTTHLLDPSFHSVVEFCDELLNPDRIRNDLNPSCPHHVKPLLEGFRVLKHAGCQCRVLERGGGGIGPRRLYCLVASSLACSTPRDVGASQTQSPPRDSPCSQHGCGTEHDTTWQGKGHRLMQTERSPRGRGYTGVESRC